MFIKALGEAIGVDAYRTPNTIGGVIDRAQGWLLERCDSDELLSSISELLEILKTHQSGDGGSDKLSPELKSIRNDLMEGFESTQDALEDMKGAVASQDHSVFKECLAELEESAAEVRSAQVRLDEWMNAPIPRCPTCGSSGDGVCEPCRAERLIPDPDFSTLKVPKSLGPAQSAVLEAYLAVLSGTGRLETLSGTLDELEKTTDQLETLGERAQEGDPELVARVKEVVYYTREGIDLMRRTRSSRRTADLNQGWKSVLKGGLLLAGLAAGDAEPGDQVILRKEE